jgi:hypothetical protein
MRVKFYNKNLKRVAVFADRHLAHKANNVLLAQFYVFQRLDPVLIIDPSMIETLLSYVARSNKMIIELLFLHKMKRLRKFN